MSAAPGPAARALGCLVARGCGACHRAAPDALRAGLALFALIGSMWMTQALAPGVIVFFLQIDTLTQKNSNRDKHLQNRLSRTPCAFGAD